MPAFLRLLATAALCGATTFTTFARVERTVERVFTVQPGGTLTVGTDGGSIEVQTSDAPQVKVVAKEHIRAESEAEADELLKDYTLTMEPSGQGVAVTGRYAERPPGFRMGSWPPVETTFVVTVPKQYGVDLKTAGGSIEVADLAGHVAVRTSGGDLKLGKITGDVEGVTSGGNIDLDAGQGKIRLVTSGGNVSADHLTGPAELATSGGNIQVGAMAGLLNARTSGGSVRVEFVGALQGDSVLATNGGSVKVKVERGVGFRLDASTSGGSVKVSDLVVEGQDGRKRPSHVAGPVSGGGPLLKLRSSGGDVAIAAR